MDQSVAPGNDFYRYANGRGLGRLVIPSDQVVLSPFTVLADRSGEQVRKLADDAAAGRGSSRDADKLGKLYRSSLDRARVEALGARPIKSEMRRILGARSKAALIQVIGGASGLPSSAFELMIQPDPSDTNRYAVMIRQPVLGLPDRDYYLTDRYHSERAAYARYIAQILTGVGFDRPPVAAIIRFETREAEVSWPAAERRDPLKTYNPVRTADLPRIAPGFPWRDALRSCGLAGTQTVVLTDKSAIVKTAAIFATTDLATLKAWALFRMIDNAAPYLSSAFADPSFEFRDRTLGGVQSRQPRWKQAVDLLNAYMSDAVGRAYVEKYFSPERKRTVETLVDNLRGAMGRRIEGAAWMSAGTKAKALQKLDALRVEVGYPDKWRDYRAVSISQSDLYGNIERLQAADWKHQVARRNGPVDKTEWALGPQFATAYNISAFNKIVFPAAILQPPFFNPAADAAVNYGAIGAVIGHEITHSFDDKGRRLDPSGRLRDWWTAADAAHFEAPARQLIEQYSNYEVLPGLKVNGSLTVGENIADLGGVLVALDAYHNSLGTRSAAVIAGLTGDQRFFLSWAQLWRSKRREQFINQMAGFDPHAPDQFRVNGVLPNIDAWYEAFGVERGDALYVALDRRIRVW
ncbi:MAG: M13 family metallopeptidase [Sphingomicrobium sp.]